MIEFIAAVVVGIVPMIPAVFYFLRQRRPAPTHAARGLIIGMMGFNVIVGLMALGIGIVWLTTPVTVMAAGANAQQAAGDPYGSLAAAIATGLATVGAGIAVAVGGCPCRFGSGLCPGCR